MIEILLVDDDPSTTQIFESMFNNEKISSDITGSVEGASEKIMTKRYDFHIIDNLFPDYKNEKDANLIFQV